MNDRNAQVRPMSKESEKKELTGVCMIDQSTAYYILSHEIFAEKLTLYNFDEAPCKLMCVLPWSKDSVCAGKI